MRPHRPQAGARAEAEPGRGGDPCRGARAAGPVLLIEDDPIERQRIGSFIEAAGYEVTRAASGEEGLALLRSRPFAAVVLDLVMPEMSGLDVLRAARTEDRLADVRFIVLSAMYMTKNERAGAGTRGHRRGAQGRDDAARADVCARTAPSSRAHAGAARASRRRRRAPPLGGGQRR